MLLAGHWKRFTQADQLQGLAMTIDWDNFKYTNVHILGVLEGGEGQDIENIFEKNNDRNFSNLVQEVDIQVQEAQRVPN